MFFCALRCGDDTGKQLCKEIEKSGLSVFLSPVWRKIWRVLVSPCHFPPSVCATHGQENVKDTDGNICPLVLPDTHLPKHCWNSQTCPPCQCWTHTGSSAGLFYLLLKWQFCSLSYFLQVLRPGSRYKVSVTGVRTGNESGSITTEFTTGEAQQKTRVVVTACVRDPCSAQC